MTDKETYLEQRKTYEHVLACMQENIEKQMAAVTKMVDVDVTEVAGLEMLEGQLKLTGLNREMLFNKPSDMTYREWIDSDARYLLNQIPKDVVEWVYEEDMTDEEKAAHPTYETTGGYLKVLDESECGQLWWGSLSDRRKEIIKAIPNFDAEIFFQCTGVRVDE